MKNKIKNMQFKKVLAIIVAFSVVISSCIAYQSYAAENNSSSGQMASATAIEKSSIPAPEKIKATRVDGTTIKLKWSAVSKADGYSIYLYDYSKKKYKKIKTLQGKKKTSYIIKNVNVNTTKKIRVRAYIVKRKKKYVGLPAELKTDSLTHTNIIGHRGAMDVAPENTIASFKKSNELGYESYECDVRYSAKGNTFFICHDENLKKLCGVDILVNDITKKNRYDYPIKNAQNVDEYDPQYLPTLKEVLTYGKSTNMRVFLHIRGELNKDQVAKLIKQIRQMGMEKRVYIFSESKTVVTYFEKYKDIEHGFLYRANTKEKMKKAINFGKSTHCKIIFLKYYSNLAIPEDIAYYAHENGMLVATFSYLNQNMIDKMKAAGGVDYCVVNKQLNV